MAPPVAIVTGASSGLGLALTKYLLERRWGVVMIDVNRPKEQLDNTLFVACDVSTWDQQASAFQQAYAWHGRLDFVALNAGIDDRDDIFNSISGDPDHPPKEPNMKTIGVCFIGVYYGIKLAAHYLSLDSKAAGKPTPGGKIVVTSSGAGIYPNALIPQYCSAKTGLVALVRSLSATSAAVNIRVNAVCPALIPTNIVPPALLETMTEDQFTPLSTVLRAFSVLADIENVTDEDWVGKGKNGEAVECNMQDLIWHNPLQRQTQATDKSKAGLMAWKKVYVDRNRKWAATEWKTAP